MKKLLIIWVHRPSGRESDTAIEFETVYYNKWTATEIHFNICKAVSDTTLNTAPINIRIVNIIHL